MDQDQPENENVDSQPSTKDETKEVDLVPAAMLKEWITKHAEEKQSKEALKTELSKVRQRSLDEEEFESYQKQKQDRVKRAEEQKKKDGKWEQIITEKEQEWSSRFKSRETELLEQLASIQKAQENTERKLRDQLVYGRVSTSLNGLCAEDVVDLAARNLVEGIDSDYRIDLNDEGELIVIDKRSGTRAWGAKGHLTITEYADAYLSKRPSLRKARVQPGSDTGRTVSDTRPVPRTEHEESNENPTAPKYVGYAKNLELIKEGVGELFGSQENWLKNRAR
jgi:hypothetical protein